MWFFWMTKKFKTTPQKNDTAAKGAF